MNRPEGITAVWLRARPATHAFAELYRQHAPRVLSPRTRIKRFNGDRRGPAAGGFPQAHRKIWVQRAIRQSARGYTGWRSALSRFRKRSQLVKMDKATDSLDRDGATAPRYRAHSPVERMTWNARFAAAACREAFVLARRRRVRAPRDQRRCWTSPGRIKITGVQGAWARSVLT